MYYDVKGIRCVGLKSRMHLHSLNIVFFSLEFIEFFNLPEGARVISELRLVKWEKLLLMLIL